MTLILLRHCVTLSFGHLLFGKFRKNFDEELYSGSYFDFSPFPYGYTLVLGKTEPRRVDRDSEARPDSRTSQAICSRQIVYSKTRHFIQLTCWCAALLCVYQFSNVYIYDMNGSTSVCFSHFFHFVLGLICRQ